MAPPPVPDRTETLTPRTSTTTATSSTLPGDASMLTGASADATKSTDDPERYEQIGEHARGGLGRVVRAIDRKLGRTVAVKELLRRGDSNEARFLREALITARLEHPGIVPVHEAGRWPNGDPYYVMKLVEGRTLKELIAERPNLRERLALLPHVIAVADAVGYAHSEGVIHRDLKPSNVIVGEFGETIVVDWGLARDRKQNVPEPHEDLIVASGSGVSTVSGKVVGTPAYMAPEQARGELVDERADVYALGAVLYELLAGTPAHQDTTPQATLERVIAGPPRPLCTVQPHAPSELVTIVTKAMSRTPDARYPNATALAEDLRRFSCGKLVSAHSYSTWALVKKKVAQHRGVVAMAAVSALALGAVGVESFRRVVAQRNIAQSERGRAVDAQSQAEKRQRELVLLQAVTSLRKDPTATIAWLKDYEIGNGDRAHVLDVIDEALSIGVARHVFRPGDWVHDAVFTPDGRAVVALVRDGVIRRYELDSGAEVELGKVDAGTDLLALSPDGRHLVTGDMRGEVKLWPLDGRAPRVISTQRGPVRGLRWAADGARLLVFRELVGPEVVALDGSPSTWLESEHTFKMMVAEQDWSRRLINTAPNQISVPSPAGPVVLAKTERPIVRAMLSPSGDHALVYDGSAFFEVPYTGGKLRKLLDFAGKLQSVSWSPDGKTFAISGERHDVTLVELATGKVRELRGHTDALYMTQWTRDGKHLLSASDDGTARFWNLADGTSIVMRGHDDDVWRARLSPDETRVVTASLDGSVRVWRIDQPAAHALTEGHPIEQMWIEGDRAVVITPTGVSRWDLATGERERVFEAAAVRKDGWGVSSRDGEIVIVPGADWTFEVRRNGSMPLTAPVVLRGHKSMLSDYEITPENVLFTSSYDGTIRRWDLSSGASTVVYEAQTPVRTFAVANDGRIVVGSGDATTLVHPDGRREELGRGPEWCFAKAEFEPVRQRLLLRRCDHSILMLDGDRRIELPTGGYTTSQLAVSRDGSRIAGAMGDRTVRLWDAATGNVLAVLRGHTDLVWEVAFSPDGMSLASASYDRTIRVWQLASRRHRVLRGHSGSVQKISWTTPDRIVTGSADGTIRIWNVPTLEIPSAQALRAMLETASSARIDIDRPTTGQLPRRGT